MKTTVLLAAAFFPALTAAFGVAPSSHRIVQRAGVELEMAKGFDKEAKPVQKEKTSGQVQRDKMGSQYDNIAAAGGQEYSIFVRQFGGEDESWLPCGSVAVPRNGQVSDAIFANEGPLMVAIVRTFPKLKGFEAEFEYGYNLKVFPDDPVEVALKQSRDTGLSVGNWISTLLSPIDASKSAPPPS